MLSQYEISLEYYKNIVLHLFYHNYFAGKLAGISYC